MSPSASQARPVGAQKRDWPLTLAGDRVDVARLCFYVGYGLWLVVSVARASMFAAYVNGSFSTALRLICYAFVFLSVLAKGRYSLGMHIGAAIAAAMALAVHNADTAAVYDTIFIIFCSKGQDFDEVARFTAIELTVLLVAVYASSQVGIIQDYVIASASRPRHFIGFLYALRPAQIAFLITCLSVYCRRGVTSPVQFVALVVLNAVVYCYTDSRMSMLMSALAIVAGVLFRRNFPLIARWKLLAALCVGSYVIAAFLSIVVSACFDPSVGWMAFLDSQRILAGRLTYGQQALVNYGVTLFGQHLNIVGRGVNAYGSSYAGTFFYIDCLYVKLLVQYGVVFFLVFVLSLTACCYKAWKDRNPWALFFLALMAVHSMIDDLTMYLNYNTFLLLIGSLMVVRSGLPRSQRSRLAELPASCGIRTDERSEEADGHTLQD